MRIFILVTLAVQVWKGFNEVMDMSPESAPDIEGSGVSREDMQRVHTRDAYGHTQDEIEDIAPVPEGGGGRMSFLFSPDGSVNTEISGFDQS